MIDDCSMQNGWELINIVEKNTHTKMVMTGHVRNNYSIKIGSQAKLETGLSSFAQFKYGGTNEIKGIDTCNFGYKTYEIILTPTVPPLFWLINKKVLLGDKNGHPLSILCGFRILDSFNLIPFF